MNDNYGHRFWKDIAFDWRPRQTYEVDGVKYPCPSFWTWLWDRDKHRLQVTELKIAMIRAELKRRGVN